MTDNKPLKSIIKRTPSKFVPRDDRKTRASGSGDREISRGSTGYFQLGVPAFFGGSANKSPAGSSNHSRISNLGSLGSVNTIDDHHVRSGQRVRFQGI